MRRIIIILLLVLGIHVTIASRAQAPTMNELQHGIKLTSKQQRDIKDLVNLYKLRAQKLCDLYQQGTTSEYVHRTPGEFQYQVKKAHRRIMETIEKIKDFYERVGMQNEHIAQKITELKRVLGAYQKQSSQ